MSRKNHHKLNKPVDSGKRPVRAFETVPELDLHALTVMEALSRLDEFLHDAFQAGHYRVRGNHGKGTGVLKLEVSRYLSGHPLVLAFRAADMWHGGDGVTEVDLSYR